MPNRFDSNYKFGRTTPLSDEELNKRWRDVDNRLATIEALTISWEEALRVVQDRVLDRSEDVIAGLRDQLIEVTELDWLVAATAADTSITFALDAERSVMIAEDDRALFATTPFSILSSTEDPAVYAIIETMKFDRELGQYDFRVLSFEGGAGPHGPFQVAAAAGATLAQRAMLAEGQMLQADVATKHGQVATWHGQVATWRGEVDADRQAAEAAKTAAETAASNAETWDPTAYQPVGGRAIAAELATASDIKAVKQFVLSPSELAIMRANERGTSWYWEALNTATRGRKRRFPARGVVVARDGSITIYDATDLDGGVPRMWRVFGSCIVGGGVGVLLFGSGSGHDVTGIDFVGGTLFITLSAGASPDRSGVHYLDFVNDVAGKIGRLQVLNGEVAPLVRYFDTPITRSTRYGPVVSGDCTALDTHIYPGAPLDDYGRPIPTIAVATDAGASVIHPDGRVVDVTYSTASTTAVHLGEMLTMSVPGSINYGPIPYTDTTLLSWRTGGVLHPGSVPRVLSSTSTALTRTAQAGAAGLTLIAREPDLAKSAVAHITKDYATGWMAGDCKLATLCDGTTGTITGGTVPDRSGAGNTLTVNGTLSRTADAGTDLVWHGPFTTANYYSRAHDGDFDFTGDFDISLWISNVGTLDSFVSYQDAGESTFGDGAYIILQTAPDGALRARLGGASGSVTLTGPIVTGTVSALRLRRTGSLIEMLVNGRVVASTSSPVGSLANASATFRVGVITYNGALVDVCDGKIALLRLSATASTSAQAAKAYRDERARLNGYGLLGGTSNNVTSLAEDPTTGALTAGAGDGASKFLNLRRIGHHDSSSTGGLMTSDSVVSVGSAGGYTAIGTAAEAIVLREAVNFYDEIVLSDFSDEHIAEHRAEEIARFAARRYG